jgi:isopenicillin N synthase-like dioxygenase
MQILTINYTDPHASEAFSHSLHETGFAVLSHHPIPSTLIHQVYQDWQGFFASETKHHYPFDRQKQDGYFPFKSENAKYSTISDLKEFYHFYPWGRLPEGLSIATTQLRESLATLATTLLDWVEKHLPAQVAQDLSMPLSTMIHDSHNTLFRILHYPPLQNAEQAGAVRSAPHEDINLLTLLPAATAPGLEVQDNAGHWHQVTCDQGNIVVNAGDMLQMCTQHYYRSTTHRVVNPMNAVENTSRYSMPFFLHPRDEVVLAENYTAVQYKRQRLKEIGLLS